MKQKPASTQPLHSFLDTLADCRGSTTHEGRAILELKAEAPPPSDPQNAETHALCLAEFAKTKWLPIALTAVNQSSHLPALQREQATATQTMETIARKLPKPRKAKNSKTPAGYAALSVEAALKALSRKDAQQAAIALHYALQAAEAANVRDIPKPEELARTAVQAASDRKGSNYLSFQISYREELRKRGNLPEPPKVAHRNGNLTALIPVRIVILPYSQHPKTDDPGRLAGQALEHELTIGVQTPPEDQLEAQYLIDHHMRQGSQVITQPVSIAVTLAQMGGTEYPVTIHIGPMLAHYDGPHMPRKVADAIMDALNGIAAANNA